MGFVGYRIDRESIMGACRQAFSACTNDCPLVVGPEVSRGRIACVGTVGCQLGRVSWLDSECFGRDRCIFASFDLDANAHQVFTMKRRICMHGRAQALLCVYWYIHAHKHMNAVTSVRNVCLIRLAISTGKFCPSADTRKAELGSCTSC